jgi:hypothetical protein
MRIKSHQRIIREKKELEKKNDLFGEFWHDLDLTPQKSRVVEISKETATEIILEYEWLGTMPAGSFLYTGLYIDNILAGVEVFTNVKSGGYYTYLNEPATLLARGACVHWAPKWSNSFLVSKSLKILEQKYSGEPRYVIAYSDWEAGELGTIYQACNWFYVGHREMAEWRSPSGKRFDTSHHRDLAKALDKNFKENKKINPEIVKQQYDLLLKKGYYRSKTMRGTYIYVIGYNGKRKKELIEKIKKIQKPYPKEHKNEKENVNE